MPDVLTRTAEPETVGQLLDQLPPVGSVPTPIVATPAVAVTPMELLDRALARGADPAALTQLFELQERWEAAQSKKAFVKALAAFKAEPPTIMKNKKAGFGEGTKRTEYEFASLDMVAALIGQALSVHGLSHRWRTSQTAEGRVSVTCILTHELGYSEETALAAPADTSGAKNNIQAIGSTVSYLERYTLLAAVGLAAKGQDSDTSDIGGAAISDDQKRVLVSMMQEAEADVPRFLKLFNIPAIDELPSARFRDAKDRLQEKINAALSKRGGGAP